MYKYICILLILLAPLKCFSNLFYSNDIKKIYKALPSINIDDTRDTTYSFNISLNDRPVPCHIYVEDSVVCHIGLQIFPDSILRGYDKWIYRFIERKFLLYILTKSTTDIARDLSFNNAAIYIDQQKAVASKDYMLLAESTDSSIVISIQKDSMLIKSNFQNAKCNLFFVFRRNCFNVLSTNKIEADWYLQNNMVAFNYHKANFITPVLRTDTIGLNDSVKLLIGKSYMEYFHADYFVKYGTGSYHTLYNEHYPIQSFISSIIKPEYVHENINVVLTHKQYKKSVSFVIALPLLINYLKQEHELYFGIEDTTDIMSGTLIAYNRSLNYIHLLCFSSTRQILFSHTPDYFCTLYSFIPTDNIANLFGKYSSSEKRNLITR